MTTDPWIAAAGAAGQWASVFVALGGIIFLWRQIREAARATEQASKSTDVDHLINIRKDLALTTVRLYEATDNGDDLDRRASVVVEYIEALATTINERLYPKAMEGFVAKVLLDYIPMMAASEPWNITIDDVERTPEIVKFWRVHKVAIDKKNCRAEGGTRGKTQSLGDCTITGKEWLALLGWSLQNSNFRSFVTVHVRGLALMRAYASTY